MREKEGNHSLGIEEKRGKEKNKRYQKNEILKVMVEKWGKIKNNCFIKLS